MREMADEPNADTAQATTEAASEQADTATLPVKEEPNQDSPDKTVLTGEGAAEKGKDVVPEKYDIKLPDDSLLDDGAVERIAAEARKQGLSNEQAQAFTDAQSAAVAEFADAEKARIKEIAEGWKAKAESDPEVGGDGFKQNSELALRVVNRFGNEEFKKALEETGLGNHPDLFRFVVKIGKAMSEDQLVFPGAEQPKEKSAEETFYGQSTSKE
jgi:hypothetical protein